SWSTSWTQFRVELTLCVCYGDFRSKNPTKICIHPNRRNAMMIMKEEEIKERLISSNPEFRRLAEEHKHYEGKLEELQNRHHMTEQDHIEELLLKKKKLHLKDQMNSMIQKIQSEASQPS